jgi:flagellar basal-body rod protein FlgB
VATPIDGLLSQALGTLEARQSVLAGDVANANTPGYAPKDVTFAGILSGTLSGMPTSVDQLRAVETAGSGLTQANGNGVDLEAALVAVQQNALTTQGVEQALGTRQSALQTSLSTLQGA